MSDTINYPQKLYIQIVNNAHIVTLSQLKLIVQRIIFNIFYFQ